MGETFTDRVEFACVDAEDHQDAEDDVGNYEEEISNAEKTLLIDLWHNITRPSKFPTMKSFLRINITFYWLKTDIRLSQNS